MRFAAIGVQIETGNLPRDTSSRFCATPNVALFAVSRRCSIARRCGRLEKASRAPEMTEMAAYAEGLGILRAANIGKQTQHSDAETTPLRDPEHYQYDFNLRDVTEVWRRGSVIASWLLDLTATALVEDQALSKFAGRVSDSGEGRWTIKAAIDEAVPAPVLSAALFARFSSRGEADYQDKLLSAMRFQFGGHLEKSEGK